MCFFVLLAMSCMRLNESPLLCYAMLCYVLCVFCSPTAKWRRCFMSLCSPQQNGGNVVSFSHRSRNGGNACFMSLFPQCLWGEGATAANAVAMRPLWPKYLDHAPCLQSRPYPDPPVWMKYWALEIINDKWSNCGSDDSSCKYWRKNSYHFILIIFLLFHITKWTAHAWVLGAQTSSHAPYYILGRRQICFILFIHHYVGMNHFI